MKWPGYKKKRQKYKHKDKTSEKNNISNNKNYCKIGSEIIILLILFQGEISVYHFLNIVLNHVLYLTTMDALYALAVSRINLFQYFNNTF
jgi:hypothetical protein